MSELSPQSTRKQHSTSPMVLSTLIFTVVLVMLVGGFGAWRFLAQRQAELEQNHQTGLETYQVDPNTGKLTKAGSTPQNVWPEGGLEDFTLIDQTGQKVTKETLKGKPWAVCFVFTRCASHCLKIMSGMRQMYEDLERSDVRLVTLTVDPDYDTPEVMAGYAAGFQADPKRWLFLSGDQEDIYRLIKNSFLLQVQEATGPDRKPGYEVDHTADVVHVDAAGRVVAKYNGLKDHDRRGLVKALKHEAKELKEGKNGTDSNRSGRPDIGEFELTERSGKTITNEDLLGKPWAVDFVFTRCAGQCLNITTNMAKLQRELDGASVRLVTITVDPRYDTPDVLKNYADNFGADPEDWLFLTGERDYVYRLLFGYFRQFVKELEGDQREKGFEVIHTPDVLHINAKGNIVKKYNGMDPADMARLRRALLEEARQLSQNPPPIEETQRSPKPAVAEKLLIKSEGK